MSITLVKVVQTSTACPSQWDAWDAEGNYYYLRYRHARGTVDRYPSPDTKTWPRYDDPDAIRAAEVASFSHGHPLDGFMELEEFCRRAGLTLAEDVDLTGFGKHLSMEFMRTIKEMESGD